MLNPDFEIKMVCSSDWRLSIYALKSFSLYFEFLAQSVNVYDVLLSIAALQASLFPHLLHNEFTDREFVRRPTRKDVGKKLLCREAWMSGWSVRYSETVAVVEEERL